MTFNLVQCPIATLAFWVAASRQVIDDSTALTGYINNRLVYLLEAKVEHELLFGDGASGHIAGLATQATPLPGTPSDLLTGTAEALSQWSALGYVGDFIVTSLTDYWTARQLKSTIGTYLIGDPLNLCRRHCGASPFRCRRACPRENFSSVYPGNARSPIGNGNDRDKWRTCKLLYAEPDCDPLRGTPRAGRVSSRGVCFRTARRIGQLTRFGAD